MSTSLLKKTITMCVFFALLQNSYARIYTVGTPSGKNSADSWLEIWTSGNITEDVSTAFDRKIWLKNMGQNVTSSSFHSPHQSIGIGELTTANVDEEIVLIGLDGIGIVSSLNGEEPRVGNPLYFRENTGIPDHVENEGVICLAIFDYSIIHEDNEIVTVSSNGIMQIWSYDELTGSIASLIEEKDWKTICIDPFSKVSIGDFDKSISGNEIAILRNDGFVDVWSVSQPENNTSGRLYVWDIQGDIAGGGSLHYPIKQIFSGEFESNRNGEELASIGDDGILEIWEPCPSSVVAERIGVNPENIFNLSCADDFLTVAADKSNIDINLPHSKNIAELIDEHKFDNAEVFDLSNLNWKFRDGDNISWALPEFDDSDWSSILVGQSCLNQGFSQGYGWYRVKFDLPPLWLGDSVVLDLGYISYYDCVFINGVPIGGVGTLPPQDVLFGISSTRRVYPVPSDILNPFGQQTLAVRCFVGSGGLYGGPYNAIRVDGDNVPKAFIHFPDLAKNDNNTDRIVSSKLHLNKYGTDEKISVMAEIMSLSNDIGEQATVNFILKDKNGGVIQQTQKPVDMVTGEHTYAMWDLEGLPVLEAGDTNLIKFNFGLTDISSSDDYNDWNYGELDYEQTTGYGWLNQPYAIYDRQTPFERQKATSDLDARTSFSDAYTFKIDIPNGVYEIFFETGFDTHITRAVFLAGDELKANNTSINETNAVFLDTGTVSAGNYPNFRLIYKVTQGYMLLGWRRSSESGLWASLCAITIRPIPSNYNLTAELLSEGVVIDSSNTYLNITQKSLDKISIDNSLPMPTSSINDIKINDKSLGRFGGTKFTAEKNIIHDYSVGNAEGLMFFNILSRENLPGPLIFSTAVGSSPLEPYRFKHYLQSPSNSESYEGRMGMWGLGYINPYGQNYPESIVNIKSDWVSNSCRFEYNNNGEIINMDVIISALSPALMIETSASKLSVFSKLNQFGLNGPKWYASELSGNIVINDLSSDIINPDMTSNWLLVWFNGAKGWDQFDMPWLLIFENKPTSIAKSETSLDISFPTNVGKMWLLPIMGREGTSLANTKNWYQSLPSDILEKIELFSRMVLAYPIGALESYELIQDNNSVLIGIEYEYIESTDFCGTQPLRCAPVPEALALSACYGFPVTFGYEPLDLKMSGSFGPTMIIPDSNKFVYSLDNSLRLVNETRKVSNVDISDTYNSQVLLNLRSEVDRLVAEKQLTEHPWALNLGGTSEQPRTSAGIIYDLILALPYLEENKAIQVQQLIDEEMEQVMLDSDFFTPYVSQNGLIIPTPDLALSRIGVDHMAWTATQLYSIWLNYYDRPNLLSEGDIDFVRELFNVLLMTHDYSAMTTWDTYAGIRMGGGIQESAHAMLGFIGYARLMDLYGDNTSRNFASYLAAKQQIGLYSQFCGNAWARDSKNTSNLYNRNITIEKEKKYEWRHAELNEIFGISRDITAAVNNWFAFILVPAPEIMRFYNLYAFESSMYYFTHQLSDSSREYWWPDSYSDFSVNFADAWLYILNGSYDKIRSEYSEEIATRPQRYCSISNARAVLESTGQISYNDIVSYDLKINFGPEDISHIEGYENWLEDNQTYSAELGHGWTFAGAVDYKEELPIEKQKSMGIKDMRDGTDLLPYTYKFDLPNGNYKLILDIGHYQESSQGVIVVGDNFDEYITNIIDESLFFDTIHYHTLPSEFAYKIFDIEVTKGYFLLGFRRENSSQLFTNLWGLEVREGKLNCDDIHDYGSGIESDLNKDCYVDISDLVLLAENWLNFE